MKTLLLVVAGLGVALLSVHREDATADLRDAGGRELGRLTLTQTPDGIQVTGELEGLPDGEHAIHLHTVGRCAPSFDAAGAHWNPTDQPHGRHFGDLPNITVKDGRTRVAAATAGGTLHGEHPLLDDDGAAVIVHQRPDDYRTPPSGAAGGRIACGVVTGAE